MDKETQQKSDRASLDARTQRRPVLGPMVERDGGPSSASGSSIKKDAAMATILVVLAFLAFAPELVLDMKPMDMDILTEGIPAVGWLAEAIRSGASILWVPGALGGFPMAFGQYSFFDPIQWVVALLLDPNRATAAIRFIYLAIAAVATYGFARVLGLSYLPSLLAGIGYSLTTEAPKMPAYGNGIQSLFLLPALLLSIELIAQRGHRWMALGTISVGLSMAAGGAYVTAIGLMSCGFYTLFRVAILWLASYRKEAIVLAVSVSTMVLLGMGTAAFRILPTMVITADSGRAQGMSLAAAAAGSPGVLGLIAGYLLPLTRLVDLGNQGEYHAPGYVGPMILLLAAMALRKTRRSPWVTLFAGLALFNILASLGDTGPLFGILHDMPGMGLFRSPQRFSGASALFLSLLAATVLNDGIGMTDQWGKRALLGGALLASATTMLIMAAGVLWIYGGEAGNSIRAFAETYKLGAANPLRLRIATALLALPFTFWLLYIYQTGRIGRTLLNTTCVALTASLLLFANLSVTLRQPEPLAPPAAARFLQEDQTLYRVISHTSSVTLNLYLTFLAGGVASKVDAEGPRESDFRYRYSAETLTANLALPYGIQSVDGQGLLQSVRQTIALAYMGSQSAALADFLQVDPRLAGKLGDIRARNLLEHLPVLQAFNVKYVLSNFDFAGHPDLLRRAFISPIRMIEEGSITEVYVYEVMGTLPRAYLVPDRSTVANTERVMDLLIESKADPSRAVMLEQPTGELTAPRLDPASSSVNVTSYQNTAISMEVQTDGSGYLVVNDSFAPGWRAWVDGVPTTILVANGWVRAVPITAAGTHSVQMSYTPPLWNEGLVVSILCALLCLAILVPPAWLMRSRRPSNGGTATGNESD